jgi:autotransporter passenger strand-loop-strand repeat protein
MDLRLGIKRIKSIYKGKNYIPGLIVNGRLWHGSPGKVHLLTKPIYTTSGTTIQKGIALGKVAYNYTLPKLWYEGHDYIDTALTSAQVDSGGRMIDTIVSAGGRLEVYFDGTVYSTTVNSGGKLDVYYGGTASRVTVSSGGYFYIYSGGTATNVTSKSGATIIVSSGGYITYA